MFAEAKEGNTRLIVVDIQQGMLLRRGGGEGYGCPYSLSQNGWDTLGSPCPLNVGVQDLVTKPR